jgi:hypothetical protein
LIFADNHETVSYEPSQSAIDISNFLNDNITLWGRERNNIRRQELFDIEGLSQKESKDLFNGLVVADRLLRNPKNKKVKELIQSILKKTG